MPDIAEHPTDDLIKAFALGKLDPPENQLVEEHLAECDPCQDRVEAVGPDTLVELLVSAQTRIDKERSQHVCILVIQSGAVPR